MGKIKKILENELVGGTQRIDIYPVTSTKAVYSEDNERLDNVLNNLKNGIDNCVTLTSEQNITAAKTFSGGISMNNTLIKGVKEPTDLTDAANKSYIDSKVVNIPVEKGTGTDSIVQKGRNNIASGEASIAIGDNTKALGSNSHAEGYSTTASGSDSHAEGAYSVASGGCSHAEGENTEASGYASHTEGYTTRAGGENSHAEGNETEASGNYSHAEGVGTITNNEGEHASGKYNVSNSDTQFSIGIGTSKSVRKNAFEVNQNGDVYVNGIGGYDGTNPTNSKDIATYLPNMVNITYEKLCELRTNSQLVTGQQYRITDYTCTTTQANTKSAGHLFDIIVTADSESKLNEEARAALHIGDTYFANSNLSAWKLWYCLDNDTNRFAWADATNGKGVIYRMIDEWNNDVPYDFKNIQFKHPTDTTTYPYYYYTFASDNSKSNTDCSCNISNNCYSNTIKEYISGKKQRLNNIVFIGINCYSNSFGVNCYSNSFGNNCYHNLFGTNCNSNSFGNRCFSNSFRNYCNSNSFGDNCYSNSFGNYCESNSFGDYCDYNSFGNNCHYIKFSSSSSGDTKYDYYKNNHFGDGCHYILFKAVETTSSAWQIQNYNFAQGLQGTSSAYLIIGGKRNLAYETKVAKNQSGEVTVYCEADLPQSLNDLEYKHDMDKEDIQGQVSDLGALARGAQRALVYTDYSKLVTALNAGMVGTDVLPKGQSIYIQQLDVPDLWVSNFRAPDDLTEYTYTNDADFLEYIKGGGWIGCHQLSLLETAKVDLSNTASKTEVAALQAEVAALKAIINEITTKE